LVGCLESKGDVFAVQELNMKNIVIIISISSIVLLSCVKKDVDGNSADESKIERNKTVNSESKIYTSASEVVYLDLVEMMETYDVKPVDPNQLVHTSAGEVTFISKKIEAPIEFHKVTFGYDINESQYREDHEQSLKLFVRYSANNELWSSWSDNCLVQGEGRGSPETYMVRQYSPSPELREQFGGAFKYYQFKLVSSPENQGEILLEELKLVIGRYGSKKTKK